MPKKCIQVNGGVAPVMEWAVRAVVNGSVLWFYTEMPGIPSTDQFARTLKLPAGTHVEYTRAGRLPDLQPHCWMALVELDGDMVWRAFTWQALTWNNVPSARDIIGVLELPPGTPVDCTQAVNLRDNPYLLMIAA